MKLKVLPVLCAAVLLTTTTAHAGTITESDLVDNSKDVDVKVTAEISSTFTVSLPATIELTNCTYSGSVGVKGDIDSGHNVYVEPSANITMHDVSARPEGTLGYEGFTHKDPVVGTVSQMETAWDYTILSSGASSGNFTYDDATQYYNTNLTITTPKLSAGNWEGTLTYNISLASNMPSVQLTGPGLYDARDNLVLSWQELLNQNVLSVNDGELTTGSGDTNTLAGKLVIDNSVTSIGEEAFYNCSSLASVTMPNSVTIIGGYSFQNCACLESVIIPDSVTSIGDNAFDNCSSLTSVTIPDLVTRIGYYAFCDCTSLTSVTFNTTSGWYVGSTAGSKETALNSSDLADTSTAATYLKTNYMTNYWTRE